MNLTYYSYGWNLRSIGNSVTHKIMKTSKIRFEELFREDKLTAKAIESFTSIKSLHLHNTCNNFSTNNSIFDMRTNKILNSNTLYK